METRRDRLLVFPPAERKGFCVFIGCKQENNQIPSGCPYFDDPVKYDYEERTIRGKEGTTYSKWLDIEEEEFERYSRLAYGIVDGMTNITDMVNEMTTKWNLNIGEAK